MRDIHLTYPIPGSTANNAVMPYRNSEIEHFSCGKGAYKMKPITFRIALAVAMLLGSTGRGGEQAPQRETSPAPLDLKQAEAEVKMHYAAAHPEVQEYVLWTARQFGRRGLWLNEDAFAALSDEAREEKAQYLATLLEEAEYGRHLC
jgi:hypothetical protein